MKPLQRTRESSKFEPDDYISSMPDIVVTNILDRLPIQEAVRTGILAKNWRFKWTMLSQLVFDENFYEYLVKTKREKNYGTIVGRLLLHLKGVITKFVIHIGKYCCSELNDEDIYHWVLFLSRNGIKDLTFYQYYREPHRKLSIHLFSCMELRRLVLTNCHFDPPASFRGFPNLLSLELDNARLKSRKYAEFYTHCPVLESFKMDITCWDNIKLVDITKLTNLKVFSFFLCNLRLTGLLKITSSSIFELVGCFPKLQELHLDFRNTEFIADGAKNGFPITFPNVKTLDFSKIYLGTGMNLSCAFQIIRSFPNLHSLEISETNWNIVPTPGVRLPEVDYKTTGLLQLRNVVFGNFISYEDELCLIKHVLACSPFLKKIVIYFRKGSDSAKKLFAKKLLKLHRASPVAEVDVRSYPFPL